MVDNIARTEDIRFSPDGRRMAIAGFAKGSILVLDLAETSKLHVVGCLEIVHDKLLYPHGVDWLDDAHLVIANRKGNVAVAALPPRAEGARRETAKFVKSVERVAPLNPISSPGSVAVVRHGTETGIWVCNNYANLMSYHPLAGRMDLLGLLRNRIAITEGLRVPDGVSVSGDARFMAVSNHNTHEVFLYALAGPGKATKVGSLGWIDYPHGLRFLPDGKGIVVADAGQPFLHVFRTETDWAGDHAPHLRLRVMDDQTYFAGRYNTQEGGIKGLDIDARRGLVVTTCEMQNLQVFRLQDFY